jgi:predicted DNA-binding transcriptional regulator AlpA
VATLYANSAPNWRRENYVYEDEMLITTRDVMVLTQLCRSTIDRARKRGELKASKFGRAIRYRMKDVKDWIASRAEYKLLVLNGALIKSRP